MCSLSPAVLPPHVDVSALAGGTCLSQSLAVLHTARHLLHLTATMLPGLLSVPLMHMDVILPALVGLSSHLSPGSNG